MTLKEIPFHFHILVKRHFIKINNVMSKMHIILVVFLLNTIASAEDSSNETKYIDLLPKGEKNAFLEKIARRIFESVQVNDNKDGLSGENVPESKMDVHDEFVKKILQEETMNMRRKEPSDIQNIDNNKNDTQVHLDNQFSDKRDNIIDLTFRNGKRDKRNSPGKSKKDSKIVRVAVSDIDTSNNTTQMPKIYDSDGEDIQIKFFGKNNSESISELEVTTRTTRTETQVEDFKIEEVKHNSNETEVVDKSEQRSTNEKEPTEKSQENEDSETDKSSGITLPYTSVQGSSNEIKTTLKSQENEYSEKDKSLNVTLPNKRSFNEKETTLKLQENEDSETYTSLGITLPDKSEQGSLNKKETSPKLQESGDEIDKRSGNNLLDENEQGSSNQQKSTIKLQENENGETIKSLGISQKILESIDSKYDSDNKDGESKDTTVGAITNASKTDPLEMTTEQLLKVNENIENMKNSSNLHFLRTVHDNYNGVELLVTRNIVGDTLINEDFVENNVSSHKASNVQIPHRTKISTSMRDVSSTEFTSSTTTTKKNEIKKASTEAKSYNANHVKALKYKETEVNGVAKEVIIENNGTDNIATRDVPQRKIMVNKNIYEKTTNFMSLLDGTKENRDTQQRRIETTTLQTEALTPISADLEENHDKELGDAKIVVLERFIEQTNDKNIDELNQLNNSSKSKDNENHDKISYNLANDMLNVLRSQVLEKTSQENNGLRPLDNIIQPKAYNVYEVPAEQLKSLRQHPSLRNRDNPYYVPVYNYSPENAYYDPRNRFGPNTDDDDNEQEIIIQDGSNDENSHDSENDASKNNENTHSILRSGNNDGDKEILRLFRHFLDRKNGNQRKFRFGTYKKKRPTVSRYKINMPVVIQYPKFTDIILSPNDYLDMDYYYGKTHRNYKSKEVSEEEPQEQYVPKETYASKNKYDLEEKRVSNGKEASIERKDSEEKEVASEEKKETSEGKREASEEKKDASEEKEEASEENEDTSKEKGPASEENEQAEDINKSNEKKVSIENEVSDEKFMSIEKEVSKEKEEGEKKIVSTFDTVLNQIQDLNSHVRMIRQHLYEKKLFGFIPSWDKTTKFTNSDEDTPRYLRVSTNNYEKPVKQKSETNISIDYFFGRMRDKTKFNNSTETQTNMVYRKPVKEKHLKRNDHFFYNVERNNTKKIAPGHKDTYQANIKDLLRENKNLTNLETIKQVLSFTPENDLLDALDKLLKIYPLKNGKLSKVRTETELDIEPYVSVLGDMVENGGEGLKQYDWLQTTVDVQAGLNKLTELTYTLKKNLNIPNPDQHLLKYAIYLHKTAKTLQKNTERRNLLPRNKNKKMGFIKTSGLLNRAWLYRKLEEFRQYEKVITDEDLNEFNEFLNDLHFFLYDLHTAVQQIANITKYKNQNWFQNIKDLYLDRSRRKLLETLLHITITRLFDLVEESAKNGLEDDFLTYVESHEKQVKRAIDEVDFALKIIKELRSDR